MRLGQLTLTLVLGLWMHTAQARCLDCGACSSQSCSSHRVCEQCPVPWWGSCYAGIEGCGYYDCEESGQLCCTQFIGGVCNYVCNCLACAG